MNDYISRRLAEIKLKELVNEMESIFADIREKEVNDCVCGLCEYDCDHGIDGFANECPGFERDDCFKLKERYRKEWTNTSDLPSVKPERKTGHWIIHSDDLFPSESTQECSECHEHQPLDWRRSDNYCPNCGAKMEVDNDQA